MATTEGELAMALQVLAPGIRDAFDVRLQQVRDLDALGTAILRYGFMGSVSSSNELIDTFAVVKTFDEEMELNELLPGAFRMMSRDPAFTRLSGRILFTPHDRSWQVALNHLMDAIEALRRLREFVFVDDDRNVPADTLATIEYVERNIFPTWKAELVARSKEGYRRYLQTQHWQRTRLTALARAMNRCEVCASTKRLEVHHKTYTNLWSETAGDLITLCHACHSKFHDKLE